MRKIFVITAAIGCISFATGNLVIFAQSNQQEAKPKVTRVSAPTTTVTKSKFKPTTKLAPFVAKGINWLVKAQNDNGGWGGGSHARQQERDPHAVKTDPATTSFATLALIRSGSSLTSGPNQKEVAAAVEYLVKTVEQASDDGPRITDLQGTQPQSKLGGLVDTTMTTQCLARVLQDTSDSHALYTRIDKALDKCIAKLEKAQKADGSWNVAGGWAPVLQSSNGLQALEMAQASGKQVAPESIARAREYQKSKVNVAGRKVAGVGGGAMGAGDAGVELYSFSSGQRGNAVDAAEADKAFEDGKAQGKLAKDAEFTVNNFQKLGFDQKRARELKDAYERNENQIKRLNDDNLLRGFGNNGGEEFVSFLLTSESMIIAGGDKWDKWNDKMHGLLKKIQNDDGSWSGHHCITSPVFCTAAVIQCLTVENDTDLLRENAAEPAKKDTGAEKIGAEKIGAEESAEKSSEVPESSDTNEPSSAAKGTESTPAASKSDQS